MKVQGTFRIYFRHRNNSIYMKENLNEVKQDQAPKNWPFPTYLGKIIKVEVPKKEPKVKVNPSYFEEAMF